MLIEQATSKLLRVATCMELQRPWLRRIHLHDLLQPPCMGALSMGVKALNHLHKLRLSWLHNNVCCLLHNIGQSSCVSNSCCWCGVANGVPSHNPYTSLLDRISIHPVGQWWRGHHCDHSRLQAGCDQNLIVTLMLPSLVTQQIHPGISSHSSTVFEVAPADS